MFSLKPSLFKNIVIWYIFCVSALAIGFSIIFYQQIENGRRAPFDMRLVTEAHIFADHLRHNEDDIDLTYVLLGELSNNYFAIYDNDLKSSILKSTSWWQLNWNINNINMTQLANSISNNLPFFGQTKGRDGQHFRYTIIHANIKALAKIMIHHELDASDRNVYIVFAELYAENNQYLGIELYHLILIILGFLMLIFISARMVARSGIRPIDKIARVAKLITPEDPQTRLPIAKMPLELVYLAKQLNDAFDRLDSALQSERTFTGAAAHEMRSPVAGITSRLDLLCRRHDLSEDLKIQINHLHSDAQRITRLSGRLLLLARLDRAAAGEDFPTAKIDLAEIARDAIDFCAINTDQKKIDFKLEESGNTIIEGHEEWLLRAIHNILNNAVKYSPANGVILVKIYSPIPSAYIKIVIIDQGPGIAHEDQAHVFERFYRSQKPGTAEGTGLGLSIVADVVRAHKGQIAIAKGPKGRGTKITILIPHYR